MKKKSRPTSESPDAGAPGAGAPASPESSRNEIPPAAEAPRRSLPAFGFASDLLKKKADEPAPEPPSEPAPAAGSPSPAPAAASPASPASPAAAAPAAGAAAPAPVASQREVVAREHLHGAVAERDLVEGLDAAEFDRTYGRLADAGEGPNRIFDFADRLAARAEERKQTGPKPRLETCLKFSLGGETFAMPVEPVQQIVRISSITRVPHAPRPIRGVTNLRGRVIPVIDLRVRVGLPAAQIDRSSRIIAVSSRGRVIGLLVDSVHQVMHLDLNLIQRPPEDVLTVESDYIAGVYHQGESLILLLDVDRALIVRDSSAA